MSREGNGARKEEKKTDAREPWDFLRKQLDQQTTIALALILVFAFSITLSIFHFSSQEVIAVAGIFGSWITAIVAFMFVERGARETVEAATRTSADLVQAKDQAMKKVEQEAEATTRATMEVLKSSWEEKLRQVEATWARKVEDLQAQLSRAETSGRRAAPGEAPYELRE